MDTSEAIWKAHTSSMPWLKDRTIYLTRHGSQAYGTALPTSDLDVKGVAVPPVEYLHGFVKKFEQAESKDPDAVIYDIRKFMGLAADCNPSIIEVLWTDDSDIISITREGQVLRNMAPAFLSKRARHTFSGYAMSQLKRIQRHYGWLHDPPDHQPTRKEFGLPENPEIPTDQRRAIEAAIKARMDGWNVDYGDLNPAAIIHIQDQIKNVLEDIERNKADSSWAVAGRAIGLDENVIVVLEQERKFTNAVREWQNYLRWKTERNPARAALEAKFGYDCKHAAHLVRLMRMCEEILTQGKVLVRRPDAEEILAIRNGAWKYEDLLQYAIDKDAELDVAYKQSKLPHAPDRGALDRVCREIVGGMV